MRRPARSSQVTADKDRGDHKGDGRSDRSNQHLRPAGLPVAAHLCDAAEQPELDALDLHAAPAGKESMSKFMSGQRGDQEHRSNHPDDPREPARRSGDGVRDRPCGNAPGKERSDDQHAPVRRDLDPSDTSDRDAASVHRASLMVSAGAFICMNVPIREAQLACLRARMPRPGQQRRRARRAWDGRYARPGCTRSRPSAGAPTGSAPAGKADGVLRQVAEARERQQRPDGEHAEQSPARPRTLPWSAGQPGDARDDHRRQQGQVMSEQMR